MEEKNNNTLDKPNIEQLEAELKRVKHKSRFRQLLRSTVYTLIVVAACAVLVAVIFLPVLRIYGNSMTPTLKEGEIVVSIKGAEVKPGDIVGVYYGSKLLIKRCIATSRQWVNIDEEPMQQRITFIMGIRLDMTDPVRGSLRTVQCIFMEQ